MKYTVSNIGVMVAQREYQMYQSGRTGSFTTHIFGAFLSADRQSFNRLSMAYPEYGYIIALNHKEEHLHNFITT